MTQAYVFWDLAIFFFESFMLWLLTRAMHPVSAQCGCRMDGSGDGGVMLTVQQSAQPQVMMVVQPQSQSQSHAPTVVVQQPM